MPDETKNTPNDKESTADEKSLRFSGAAKNLSAKFPELVARLQERIDGRAPRLAQLKERSDFLDKQLKALKQQVELYQLTGGNPEDFKGQVESVLGEMIKVQKEYTDEFNNVNPLPDAEEGDDETQIVEAIKSGNQDAFRQIQELQLSDDPSTREKASRIAEQVGGQLFEDFQEQLRFKDNNEVENVTTFNPIEADVPTAPPAQEVAQRGGILASIQDMFFKRGKSASETVAASKSEVNKNIKKGI